MLIALDNGTTASIAVFKDDKAVVFQRVPVRSQQNYTKKKQKITRIDWRKLEALLTPYVGARVIMEKPVTNGFAKAVVSGARAFESTLCILERLGLDDLQVVDSKEWQREIMPGIRGRDNLKAYSEQIGIKYYPEFKKQIEKHGDADSLLMGRWALGK